jgi:peptidoglycan hydrolase CwlO-like protein
MTKKELDNLKIIRGYGVVDLKKYIQKIKKNIAVFDQAITREKNEMKRVEGMIRVLKNDIKTAEILKKTAK